MAESLKNVKKSIEELQNAIIAAEANASALQTSIGHLKTAFVDSSLGADIAREAINKLQTSYASTSSTIDTLKSKIVDLKSAMSGGNLLGSGGAAPLQLVRGQESAIQFNRGLHMLGPGKEYTTDPFRSNETSGPTINVSPGTQQTRQEIENVVKLINYFKSSLISDTISPYLQQSNVPLLGAGVTPQPSIIDQFNQRNSNPNNAFGYYNSIAGSGSAINLPGSTPGTPGSISSNEIQNLINLLNAKTVKEAKVDLENAPISGDGIPNPDIKPPIFDEKQIKSLSSTYKNAIDLADELGFSTKNLTSVQKEGTTQISTLSFANKDADGVMNKLNITVDRHGKILQDTQKRFRGFASTIARNIGEALKWSIAIQLVWGPLKKLGELTEIMIDNEAKLANVTVTLGKEQANTAEIFRVSAEVAKLTGESINGVIEGYELAIRATGGIADESERAATSQQLLIDSMVLSKLSSLSQGEALDTVVGALKQMGMGLTEGMELIDRWVAVSRSANVSVETLAESFAITATSATNAGISIEELNGLITVVAENTTLSATESGNAVRAFISGFQTDKAVKELGSFGIAVETVTAGSLGFYDVMRNIYDLYEEGIISDSELNRIGEAIGGGARRGAQVVATIKNLGRVQEVVAAQTNFHGQAEEALAIKLDTVQTKLTELSNSFQKLGQSLGAEGGLIDGLKVILSVSTILLDTFSGLSDIMGEALPVAIALGVALKTIAFSGAGFSSNVSSMSNKALNNKALGKLGTAGAYMQYGAANVLSKTGYAIPAVGVSVGQNLISGDKKGAVGSAVGGIVGGIAGALGGAVGITIGATIGSTLGDVFADKVFSRKPEWEELFQDIVPRPEGYEASTGGKPLTEAEAIAKEQADLLEEAMGDGVQQFKIGFFETVTDIGYWVGNKIGLTGKGNISQGQSAIQVASLDDPSILARSQALEVRQQALEGKKMTVATKRLQISDAKKYSELLKEIIIDTRNWGIESLISGEISDKQWRDLDGSLSGLDSSITGWGATFGNEFIAVSDEINNMEDAYKSFANIIAKSSNEELGVLQRFQGEILGIQNAIVTATEKGTADFGSEKGLTVEELQAMESDWVKMTARLAQRINQELGKANLSIPAVIDLSEYSGIEIDSILSGVEEEMYRIFSAASKEGFLEGLTFEQWRSKFDDIFIDAGELLNLRLEQGFDGSMIPQIIANLIEEGSLAGKGIPFNVSDLTYAEAMAVNPQVQDLVNQISAAGGDISTETTMTAFADGVVAPITTNQAIQSLLLKDLIDVNEKQLEGIYNLPTDASFYVPFTGYALGQGGGGGGGGGGGWDMTQLISWLEQIANNTAPKPIPSSDVWTPERGTIPALESERESNIPKEPTTWDRWTQEQPPMPEIKEYVKKDIYDVQTVQDNDITAEPTWFTTLSNNIANMVEIQTRTGNAQLEALTSVKRFLTDLWNSVFGIEDSSKEDTSFKDSQDINTKPIETSLSLDITHTSNVLLDGIQVAQVVANYMTEEMIALGESTTFGQTTVA